METLIRKFLNYLKGLVRDELRIMDAYCEQFA
jgi:hypothetical protein